MKERRKMSIFSRLGSIQNTLLVSFSFLLLVAMVSFLAIAVSRTKNVVFDNSIDYTTQIINQVNHDIDSYFSYMENISSVVSDSGDVSQYLFDQKLSAENQEAAKQRVLSQFNTIRESRKDISNIAAVAGNGRNIVNDGGKHLSSYIDVRQQEWYQAALTASDGIYISSSHVQNAITDSYKWVITLSRALVNNLTGARDGVFFVDLNYQSISDLCNQTNIGGKGYIFILDADGNIVYHPQQQLMYGGLKSENIAEIMATKKDYLIMDGAQDDIIYTMSRSTKTGWTVVGATYTSELLKNNQQTQLIYFITMLVLLLAVILISNFISRAITKPIRHLRDSMAKVQQGNFENTAVAVTTKNEVGSLTRSFNVMTEKIHSLMQQNMYEQREKRKSELKALQAQINPHFLYNTLDSIIWMAEAGQNEQVVLMTAALAKLFRQSISSDKEQVTLKEEMDYVENYLTIQKMRYQDKLEYSIDIEDSIEQVMIIKFAIQPLVENAIYHGLKYKNTKGNLDIEGYKKGDEAVIMVSDDGVGMTAEELRHIFDEKVPDHKSNGLGVNNVQKRLQLYYGEHYGVSFTSTKGEGTVATVVIPLKGGNDETTDAQ